MMRRANPQGQLPSLGKKKGLDIDQKFIQTASIGAYCACHCISATVSGGMDRSPGGA